MTGMMNRNSSTLSRNYDRSSLARNHGRASVISQYSTTNYDTLPMRMEKLALKEEEEEEVMDSGMDAAAEKPIDVDLDMFSNADGGK